MSTRLRRLRRIARLLTWPLRDLDLGSVALPPGRAPIGR